MQPLPVPYRSNPGAFKVMGEPKIVNAYAEASGLDNKADFTLLPVAGIKTFGVENGSGCRWMLWQEDRQRLLAVQGRQLYEYSSDGAATSLGLIAGESQVYMARNDADTQEVVIISDNSVYVVVDGVLSVKQYTTTDNDGNTTTLMFNGVAFIDGYFTFWVDGKVYASELQSTEVSDLNFNGATSNPDGITACFAKGQLLYVVGTDTIEHWRVTGADFPIQPIPGSYFNFGSDAPHSIKEFNNGVALVGSDDVVYQLNGVNYRPISSNEVSRLIEAEPDKSKIVAFTHERGQHKFYVLQGTGWTREYNAFTDSWSHREDTLGNQWHCIHHARAWNRDIYGDRITGQLYEGDYGIFTDDGNEVPWGFDTQIIHDAPNGLSFDRIELDMETGSGESLTDEGEVILLWSRDNARTFAQRHLSLGKTGEYRKRVRTHGLGQCNVKGMIIGVRVTDPVVRAIAGLYGDVKQVVL